MVTWQALCITLKEGQIPPPRGFWLAKIDSLDELVSSMDMANSDHLLIKVRGFEQLLHSVEPFCLSLAHPYVSPSRHLLSSGIPLLHGPFPDLGVVGKAIH